MDGVTMAVVIILGIIALIIVIALFLSNYLKAEPSEALILTGRRYRTLVEDEQGNKHWVVRGWRAIVGGAAFRVPVIEKVSRISLELMNLSDVRVLNQYSKEGVPVTIDAVANVKIGSDEEMLARAVERFLGSTKQQIMQIIKQTLEGQLRDIIGIMTVEQLYREKDLFIAKVLEQTSEELAKIGVIIDIINIQDIRDEKGYLESLGVKRTAEVKRDAVIGRAEAERDAMKSAETARREGEVVKAEQERQIAEAQKQRDVARESYRGETLSATKAADQQGPLSEAKSRQAVVIEQQKVLEMEQKSRQNVEQAKADAEFQRYRAEVIVPADAEKQARILRAEAQAMEILKVKEAEAQGIKMVAFAEAEGLMRKAEAWNTYGEAARLNLVLEAYKTVAGMGANALGQIKFDKVVALDGGAGNGDSPVSRLMTAAPGALLKFMEQMKAATGIDIEKLVGNATAKNEVKVESKEVEKK